MSESEPVSTGRTVIKLLWRIWTEVCPAKLRSAYKRLWLLVFTRQWLQIGYGWIFGYCIELFRLQSSYLLAIGLFVPALTIVLIEYLLDWRMRFAFDRVMAYFYTAAETTIDQRFFEKSGGQHADQNGQFTQGALSRGGKELISVNEFLASGGFESVLSAGVNLGGLWLFAPKFGAVVSLTFIISLVWTRSVNAYVYTAQKRLGELDRQTKRRREDTWDAIRRVKTSGRTQDVLNELQVKTDDLHEQYRLSWTPYQHWTLGRDVINWLGFTLLMSWNIHDLYSGLTNLATFVVVAGTTYASLFSVRMLTRTERKLFLSAPHIERMFSMLDLPPDIVDWPSATPLPATPFTVRFESVSLRRESGQTTLRNISFSIGPGERVALIGPSGAGKSTVAQLLERAMNPTSGLILVNNQDLRQIRLDSWYEQVAFVTQPPQVMDGSLRDNLLFGLAPAARAAWTDVRLWKIVREFRVDFGDRLTHGLDTKVGRHGVQLSGGQAQRLLILAAAIKHPRFMVIDEATSSLDAASQRDVQQALDELLLRTKASALVIAHRLSTIRACTKFIVLRLPSPGGELQVETIASSLLELYHTSPTYRTLHDLEHTPALHTTPEAEA